MINDTQPVPPPQPPGSDPAAPMAPPMPQAPLFDFNKEKERMDDLIAKWGEEKKKVGERRRIRENKRNVQEERNKETIMEDETVIPDRTINTNIRKGRAQYINYITQGERLLIVTDVMKPGTSLQTLETWFTDGMKFPGWKLPWIKLIDCMHVHGGGALEVMWDPDKPFHCTVEFIPRDSLIFERNAKSLQAQPRLLRCYDLTPLQLEEFALKYGFREDAVAKLMDTYEEAKKGGTIPIYRALMKKQGIVYNAWYCKETDDDWLREPVQHDIGLLQFDPTLISTPLPTGDPTNPAATTPIFMSPQFQAAKESAPPMPLSQYPIEWFPYEVTENEILLEGQGRVALDLHVQEALTELYTATVNGATRASRLYASAQSEQGDDGKLRELGRIQHGKIMSHGMTLMQFPWPNPIILAVIQALGINNAQESGNTDFAAMARPDANKTKYELEMGKQQSVDNSVTDMDIFSTPVLNVLTLCFNIACHQAIFKLVPQPTDPSLLVGNRNTQPAGDIEVTKRMKNEQNAKELFNILQGTPVGDNLLMFLIKSFFPDQADAWIASMQGPNKDQMIQQLVAVLQAIPTDELSPDQLSALRNVIAAAQAMVGASSNGAPSQAANSGAPDQAPASNVNSTAPSKPGQNQPPVAPSQPSQPVNRGDQ